MIRVLVPTLVCALLAVPPQGPRSAEIAAAIQQRLDAGRGAGMVVATVEPSGSTSIAAAGNPGSGARALDVDSVFEIGSITKVFTGIVLADMVDRGEVKLDDPVARYVPPDIRVPERNGTPITLLDLATHTSALPRLPDNLRPRDPSNPYADYTPDLMFEFLGRHTLRRDVGALFEYSNLGVGLLGQALSRRAGRSYEALVRERVLDPLGMTHTAVTLSPWMRDHLARGHNALLQPAANWDLPALAGAGALRSTMGDMLVFARANLGWAPEGRGEPAARLIRVMRQTHVTRRPAGSDMHVGLNWLIRRVDEREVVWHNGGTGGYRSWIGFDPARRVAAIVLTNASIGHDDLGLALVSRGALGLRADVRSSVAPAAGAQTRSH